jgi:hypothetical protein
MNVPVRTSNQIVRLKEAMVDSDSRDPAHKPPLVQSTVKHIDLTGYRWVLDESSRSLLPVRSGWAVIRALGRRLWS